MLNNMKTQVGTPDDMASMLKRIDEIAVRCMRISTWWAVLGRIVAVPVDEAGRVALRRYPQRPGHIVAGTISTQ